MRISDWSSDVCSSDLFKLEDGEPVLTGRVDYRYRHRSTKIDQRGAQVASLAQETIKRRAKRGHAAFKLMPVRQSVFAELGEFSCDIYWFNRRVVEAVDSLSSNAAETSREISHWSGGALLYPFAFPLQIGRAACRERVSEYVSIPGV